MSKWLKSKWLKAALNRAVRTVAQSALSLIPVDVAIDAVDWRHVVSTAALAGVLSMLFSVATDLPEVDS